MSSNVRLSRRSLLRGLGFAGIAIGLPPLESMVGEGNVAHAAPGGVADRFVLFHFNHGAYMGDWIPKSTGPLTTLPDQLAPLAPHKSRIQVVSGLSNMAGGESSCCDGNPHSMP